MGCADHAGAEGVQTIGAELLEGAFGNNGAALPVVAAVDGQDELAAADEAEGGLGAGLAGTRARQSASQSSGPEGRRIREPPTTGHRRPPSTGSGPG